MEFDPVSLVIGLTIGVCFGLYFKKLMSSKKNDDTPDTTDLTDEATSYGDWGEYKMVLVVRQDLGMGKGKAAAQCCHAAVDVHEKCKRKHPKWLSSWESSACPKVALKCPDEETLLALASHARVLDIDTSIISDAGRTQIPSGSKTVLGLGPAPVELIDKVTGHLKLF